MGRKDEEFILLLDIDRVFSINELAAVGGAGAYDADVDEEEGPQAV